MTKDYNFTTRLGTQNYDIGIDPKALYGYFEHNELGEDSGGGLWFDKHFNLIDYDGVFQLPSEVKNILIQFGMISKETADDF
jgi:hypothetical protein